jgi:tRNA (cmo5U34)-methyltransferase
VGQFHFHPDAYRDLMLSEMPDYLRLQDEAAAAMGTGAARRGCSSSARAPGETARRVLARHPGADLCELRLETALPAGPFDLVFSVLAIHHLDGEGKADLFARVAAVLEPGGRFVIGDVVVPDDPADTITPLSPSYDLPSRAEDQLIWLSAAGFDASVVWAERDLAVFIAQM